MKTKKEIKQKVAAKIAKAKDKIARKTGKTAKAVLLGGVLASALCGCQNPAQRAQTADTRIYIYDGSTVTFGSEFVSLAQSNETGGNDAGMVASPTNTVDVPITVKYNDAIAGASAASKGVLANIGSGLDGVLSLMQSKGTGTVAVTKTDGTPAVVRCEGGQCEFCPSGDCGDCADGSCNP